MRMYNNAVKKIRAEIIKQYLNSIGKNECVCFSCGNASNKLKISGVETIEVINPTKWYTAEEIQNEFKVFDATSGHLPMFLMQRISEQLYKNYNPPAQGSEIATGSGETYCCLKMAFPFVSIIPVYNLDIATKFNENAPLNTLVDALYHANKKGFELLER